MIVDSNVFLHLANPDGPESALVLDAFERLSFANRAFLNPVILAEISPGFADCRSVEHFVGGLGVRLIGLTAADAFRAGQTFAAYRRNGGPRIAILSDFLIGAQAATKGWPILTRDPKRFSSYFPEVELIDPLQVPND